jgi:hypothetical protein
MAMAKIILAKLQGDPLHWSHNRRDESRWCGYTV